ncbi:MAG TPA: SPFH domain-containing protein [Phycisphaerales bacterium]|nr:SPFH domain-containing protein [Phycisphaerales bacterium]HRQ74440.1 SPFH domain-containing protein [Phycisphaerales bacterium]
MRIDHHAYQRGTRVAAFGLLLQFAIALVLLIFQGASRDTSLEFVSYYLVLGVPVWLCLIVLLYQHKLERLEALEEDELAAARAGTSSVFDATSEDLKVAARRLGLMYKWLLPSVSLVLAFFMSGLAWLMWRYMRNVGEAVGEGGRTFYYTPQVGWAIAICLFFALLSFIFSRFVAGMAKQPAWQNLRGGAGYMVGNALVLLAVAAGLGFRVFGNDQVIIWVAYAIVVYMWLISAEIILNFILNLYRPRIVGETPRAAFDSRVLSLLAAPDSIVRSLNQAIDYQFGFDITSSWGYQLLLRSFVWLLAIGVSVMVLLNTMVIVEPHQQAIRLRFGQIVGEVHEPGIMWKLPWPIETAKLEDVSLLRQLPLTARRTDPYDAHIWTEEYRTDVVMEPFIVASASLELDQTDPGMARIIADRLEDLSDQPLDDGVAADPLAAPTPAVSPVVAQSYALLDGEISLTYRIRRTPDGSGLMQYLNFAPDTYTRRAGLTVREQTLRALALREVTQYLSRLSIDDALSLRRADLAEELRRRVQAAFDSAPRPAGVEVVAVNIPMMRPAGERDRGYGSHENLTIEHQNRQARIAMARREVITSLTVLAGDPDTARRILEELDEWDRLRDQLGLQAPETIEKRIEIERLLVDSGGRAAQFITQAERDRWVELMTRRAQANRTLSQTKVYRAGPALYREREYMRILAKTHAPMRKYLIGIDPERLFISANVTELSPLLDFSSSISNNGDNE